MHLGESVGKIFLLHLVFCRYLLMKCVTTPLMSLMIKLLEALYVSSENEVLTTLDVDKVMHSLLADSSTF